MLETLALVVGGAIVGILYFVPSIVAFARKHEKAGWIFLLNLLAGWTLLGWGVALVLAEGPGELQLMEGAGEATEEELRKRAA